MGFPCGSAVKESACNVGDLASISGLGRSPGEGKGYPLRYSGLENSMDFIVYGVTKSLTTEQLSLHMPYILEQVFKNINRKHPYVCKDFSLNIEEKYPLVDNVNNFQILLRHE